MSFFGKSDTSAPKSRDRALPSSRPGSSDATISIIGPGMVIEGDIVTEGTVRVEGELRGTVRAGRSIIVGQEGRVEGNLITEEAVIAGAVAGSIIARNRIELQSTCSVVGEIRTRAERLKLEEGARFAGHIEMDGADQNIPIPALMSGDSGSGDEEPIGFQHLDGGLPQDESEPGYAQGQHAVGH